MKTCSECGEAKDLSAFSENKHTVRGRVYRYKMPYCRPCNVLRAAAWRTANPGKRRQTDKAWRDRNAAAQRRYRLAHEYGIDQQRWDELLIEQCGRCAICSEQMTKYNEPHLDHCHVTGVVRGLLCHFCNTRIVPAIESGLIARGVEYVRRERT